MRSDMEAVLIGGSAGSGKPIETILRNLPPDFPIPIIVVRHLGEGNDKGEYYRILSSETGQNIIEAEDKVSIARTTVYFSPPGYHLLIERDRRFALDLSPRHNFSRPSIDILFQSAAKAFGPSVTSIILSGANSDGAVGSGAIHDAGGFAIAQSPAEAEFPKMPQSAVKTGKIDVILTIDEIIYHIIEENDKSRKVFGIHEN